MQKKETSCSSQGSIQCWNCSGQLNVRRKNIANLIGPSPRICLFFILPDSARSSTVQSTATLKSVSHVSPDICSEYESSDFAILHRLTEVVTEEALQRQMGSQTAGCERFVQVNQPHG